MPGVSRLGPPWPGTTPAVDLVVEQNEEVEADIMFYKDHLIWHMVDRADRWHAACEIKYKTPEEICQAISTT